MLVPMRSTTRAVSRSLTAASFALVFTCLLSLNRVSAAESWTQFKFDPRNSGDAHDREVGKNLGLAASVALTDKIFTAPVVDSGSVFVVDGSGVAFALDAENLRIRWKVATPGGRANCNNVSSPALIDGKLHFGTMAGQYFVLDAKDGSIIRQIRVGEPVFSSPVVANGRVYFASLGSRVYALEPDGAIVWTWDYVTEQLGFPASGDRWSGADWLAHQGGTGRAGPAQQFHCGRDIVVAGQNVIVPAGGKIVWLEDSGPSASFRAVNANHHVTLGLSIAPDGRVLRQWHRLDNGGAIDVLELNRDPEKGARIDKTGFVKGTQTGWNSVGLLSFASVSVRGHDVYRSRVQAGFGLCRHSLDGDVTTPLQVSPSGTSAILTKDYAIIGGLDGTLHLAAITDGVESQQFRTAFGEAINAPVAVCDGRVYFGCEDGYVYALASDVSKPLPDRGLELWKQRTPRTGALADKKYDRFTSFDNWSNTNATTHDQKLGLPTKLRWIRRFEGTTKHFSTFGGGRMYTHTAEGQVFAVEQETGRLLWRVYYPGVHNCYTSPLYHDGHLLVPQAGFQKALIRKLDAATGALVWEAPFKGSPSWNRQLPPVISKNLAIYGFGTGVYGERAPSEAGEKKLPWLFEHQNNASFPKSHRPVLNAYDLGTGRVVWSLDFSAFGSGGDETGVCLLDGVLYYSTFFGHSPNIRRGRPGARGLTAAIDPETGKIIWLTTKYWMNGGCTISGSEGRLYLGGYNPVRETKRKPRPNEDADPKPDGESGARPGRYVWCLDASDGSLIWRSEPLLGAIQVVTVGSRFVFAHAQYQRGYLIDKYSGKVLSMLKNRYKCTRFTLSEPYLVGANADLIDVTDPKNIKLVSTGPGVDPSDCVGAVVSNGRLFYTGHGSGLQLSYTYGSEARR